MSGSFLWCVYVDDNGDAWAEKVSATYQAMPERGWFIVPDPNMTQYPRGWIERRVWGLDANGNRRWAECATNTCDLWTDVVSTFQVMGNDGVLFPVDVLGKSTERRLFITLPAG